MTVADAWPLQQQVYSTVAAAVAAEGLTVVDHVPTNPPDEFVRLDGLNIDDDSWKDSERGRHAFMIHFFVRPTSQGATTRGFGRVHTILAMIHAAVLAMTYNGKRPNFEYKNVDPDEDGVTTHGVLRYTITI